MRKRYTGEQRSELVDLVTDGHATVPEAAARLEVPHSTAYKWLRQATKPPQLSARKTTRAVRSTGAPSVTTPTFLQLVRAGEAASMLAVQIGGVAIEVRRGFDGQLLRAVVEALRGDVG